MPRYLGTPRQKVKHARGGLPSIPKEGIWFIGGDPFGQSRAGAVINSCSQRDKQRVTNKKQSYLMVEDVQDHQYPNTMNVQKGRRIAKLVETEFRFACY